MTAKSQFTAKKKKKKLKLISHNIAVFAMKKYTTKSKVVLANY
jgi:hypothetical protein